MTLFSFPEEEICSLVRRSQNPVSPYGGKSALDLLRQIQAPSREDLHELTGCLLPAMFLRCFLFQILVSYLFLFIGLVRVASSGIDRI